MDIKNIIREIDNYVYYDYPLKILLKNTEQDKVYHQEGNVWTHTKLVMQNLFEDKEFQDLDKQGQKVLVLSAFLHDIGKDFTSKEVDGRIKTPNHAVKGVFEARKIIYKFDFLQEIFGEIDFDTREEVCSLVRYHGLPLFIKERKNRDNLIIKVSHETSCKHLAILSRADANGRICPDQEDFSYRVNSFIEEAKTLECYEDPRQFVDDKSKMFYFLYGENYLYYSPYGDKTSNVTMISGLPGSGKSTYIEENFSGTNIISLDDLRRRFKIAPSKNQGKIIQASKEIAKTLLANKEDFVWDATNTSRMVRDSLLKMFADYNANVNIVYIETDYKNLIYRNNTRERPVPEKILDKLIENLDPPKLWECIKLKNVIN